jgi:hypothetical protein
VCGSSSTTCHLPLCISDVALQLLRGNDEWPQTMHYTSPFAAKCRDALELCGENISAACTLERPESTELLRIMKSLTALGGKLVQAENTPSDEMRSASCAD